MANCQDTERSANGFIGPNSNHVQNETIVLQLRPNDPNNFAANLDTLRFHKVDFSTLVPFNGKAAKDAARRVDGGGTPDLFLDEFGEPKVPMAVGRNLVVGVVATPYHGLQRITVGELCRFGHTQRYGYDAPVAEVWGDFVQPTATPALPVEEVPDVLVTLKTDRQESGVDRDDAVKASGAGS